MVLVADYSHAHILTLISYWKPLQSSQGMKIIDNKMHLYCIPLNGIERKLKEIFKILAETKEGENGEICLTDDVSFSEVNWQL